MVRYGLLALLSGFTLNAQAVPAPCSRLEQFKIAGTELAIATTEEIPAAAAGTVRLNGRGPETIPVAMPAY